jgi:hypothetical protein
LKPFADVSNLEQVRGFLRDRGIAIVVHGHKHEHSAQFEHIYDQDGDLDHRTLVISGGTFEPGRESDAARLITITGMPNSPAVAVESVSVPRSGVDARDPAAVTRRIWSTSVVPGAPVVIQGSIWTYQWVRPGICRCLRTIRCQSQWTSTSVGFG